MSQQVATRTATVDDIAAIQHVANVTWRATYGGRIPGIDIEQFLSRAYSESAISASIGRLSDGFVVAAREDQIIGYAMAGLNHVGEAELFAIYVLPEHQGSGAGCALWDAALAALMRQGQLRMCCWVLVANVHARRFYERQGAILTEEREFHIGATTIREARYCVTS